MNIQSLGEAKLVFSANLQETLGISWYEGLLVNAIPWCPDRLSYSEMAIQEFKYPAYLQKTLTSYEKHKEELKNKILPLYGKLQRLSYSWIQRPKLFSSFPRRSII